MKSCRWGVVPGILLLAGILYADQPATGWANTTVLIIRHAEKPPVGRELTPEGLARAQAYVGYFEQLRLEGQPLRLDHLFCTADSAGSERPRLTVEPLGRALKLPLDNRFKSKEAPALAAELRREPHGATVLICWHHGDIPLLLQSLGADPALILPKGKWPDTVFGWMIELRYDAAGRLQTTRLIHENLMPYDH